MDSPIVIIWCLMKNTIHLWWVITAVLECLLMSVVERSSGSTLKVFDVSSDVTSGCKDGNQACRHECNEPGGWNLWGSDWGCCGNYEGCCTYASLICYFHDALCRCCDVGKPEFCGPACKPEPECGVPKTVETCATGSACHVSEKSSDPETDRDITRTITMNNNQNSNNTTETTSIATTADPSAPKVKTSTDIYSFEKTTETANIATTTDASVPKVKTSTDIYSFEKTTETTNFATTTDPSVPKVKTSTGIYSFEKTTGRALKRVNSHTSDIPARKNLQIDHIEDGGPEGSGETNFRTRL